MVEAGAHLQFQIGDVLLGGGSFGIPRKWRTKQRGHETESESIKPCFVSSKRLDYLIVISLVLELSGFEEWAI